MWTKSRFCESRYCRRLFWENRRKSFFCVHIILGSGMCLPWDSSLMPICARRTNYVQFLLPLFPFKRHSLSLGSASTTWNISSAVGSRQSVHAHKIDSQLFRWQCRCIPWWKCKWVRTQKMGIQFEIISASFIMHLAITQLVTSKPDKIRPKTQELRKLVVSLRRKLIKLIYGSCVRFYFRTFDSISRPPDAFALHTHTDHSPATRGEIPKITRLWWWVRAVCLVSIRRRVVSKRHLTMCR